LLLAGGTWAAASGITATVNLLRTAVWLPLLSVLSVVELKLLNAVAGAITGSIGIRAACG
jgi:hypothetical protein